MTPRQRAVLLVGETLLICAGLAWCAAWVVLDILHDVAKPFWQLVGEALPGIVAFILGEGLILARAHGRT